MNNVMIGGLDGNGKSWAFYETNGCGMGARPNADGIVTRSTPCGVRFSDDVTWRASSSYRRERPEGSCIPYGARASCGTRTGTA